MWEYNYGPNTESISPFETVFIGCFGSYSKQDDKCTGQTLIHW